MFVSVAETNVGSLLCFGVGVVQSLFNFFLFLCVCVLRHFVIAPVRNTKKLPRKA